ncbi:MAG: thioredoxin [Bacilli bacterium]|jgi:thioredoxin 1
MILHLKNENFDDLLKGKDVLVDFFATWCGPCKMLSPIVEEVAEEHPEVLVIKVDVDEHNDLAAKFQIYAVPTLVFFKDGKIQNKSSGYMPKPQVLRFIKK